MPVVEIILDYFLQYIGSEYLKQLTYNLALWFQNLFERQIVKAFQVLFNKNNTFVIHRDNDFLVINKPPNILVNSNDLEKETVQTILERKFPDLRNSKLTHSFHFAHRLDYSTSGILCLPLNKSCCTKICKAFEKRIVEKYYIGILNGHFKGNNYFKEINFAIGEDSRKKESKAMCSTKSGEFCENPRESRTFVYFCQNGYYKKTIPVTKAILMPITGRRHQLRVHCCDINQPILGDFTYGNDYDKTMNRMCLHAARINVPDQLDLSTSDPFIGTSFDGLTIDIEKIYSEIQALKQLLLQ